MLLILAIFLLAALSISFTMLWGIIKLISFFFNIAFSWVGVVAILILVIIIIVTI